MVIHDRVQVMKVFRVCCRLIRYRLKNHHAGEHREYEDFSYHGFGGGFSGPPSLVLPGPFKPPVSLPHKSKSHFQILLFFFVMILIYFSVTITSIAAPLILVVAVDSAKLNTVAR